ncbi:MAG: ASKHA domain-containing protein [Clostridia bacterium]
MKVTINQGKKQRQLDGKGYRSIYQLLKKNGMGINAPCGGARKCGKCHVKVENCTEPVSDHEAELLGRSKMERGYRLACFIPPNDGMIVTLVKEGDRNQILTESRFYADKLDPPFKLFMQVLDPPGLGNQTSDYNNIRSSAGMDIDNTRMDFLNQISHILRSNGFCLHLLSYKNKIIGVTERDISSYYGVAVDIGTTTVAAYLFNLATGQHLDVLSDLNRQKPYGADVISRIHHASGSDASLEELKTAIISQINDLVRKLVRKNNIHIKDIYLMTLAGNTTMMHLAMGLDPEHIGKSPFIPVTVDLHEFLPSDMGIRINKEGRVVCLPSLSGYIGADVVAGIIATDMHHSGKISILLDIGTNGEIVLGNRDRMVSCSTAAGPAFEGTNIRFGTGGISGAIDSVLLQNGKVVFTTIHHKHPVGICGSGVVDIVAELLRNNIIDETGRFDVSSTDPQAAAFSDRVVKFEGMTSFQLTDSIFFTQKDIREVQNAKAAIAAGLNILIRRYPTAHDEIDKLYLAGGFGNYINVESAVAIGLLPSWIRERVEPVGNTAGAGASMCLINQAHLEEAVHVSNMMEYIELSSDREFTEEYVECMIF